MLCSMMSIATPIDSDIAQPVEYKLRRDCGDRPAEGSSSSSSLGLSMSARREGEHLPLSARQAAGAPPSAPF